MTDSPSAPVPFEDTPAFRLAEIAAHAALAKKGEDVAVLDLRGRSDVADYFVLATGGSDVQVDAIARGVLEEAHAAGQKPLHGEGRGGNRWVLLDFFDVVVHVFQASAREYYALERLWNDAPRLDVTADHFARPEVVARHPDLTLTRIARRGADVPDAEEES